MIYLFYGQDSFRMKQGLEELLSFFKSQINNAGVFEIGPDNFNKEKFDFLLKSQNLFSGKSIIICRDLLGQKTSANIVSENIEKCASSQNIFFFLEEEIKSDILELIEPKSEKVQKFENLSGAKLKKWLDDEIQKRKVKISLAIQENIIKKCGGNLWCISSEINLHILGGELNGEKRTVLNPFQICDAVAEKNRKSAWILLQKALLSGVPAEEVFWKIWWQVKVLLLVKNQPQGLDLHPFVIKKNLRNIKNFTQEELKNLSWNLVDLYHKTRKGQAEFETGLEKILISL